MNKYWLALGKIEKIGPPTLKKLYDHFKSGEAIWTASTEELSRVEGISRLQIESLLKGRSEIDPDAELESVNGHEFLSIEDADYPEKLKNIYDPPPVLFYRGSPNVLNKRSIGIVGTRKPSQYGLSAAQKFAGELSRFGFVINSGLAYGIDTAAHKSALDAGGETVAVFGCGIDLVYPAENIRLAESISQSGCLLSEFLPWTPTADWTFPRRNRIISGLSLGVIIVEGTQDSGSLITAKLALEQGREVYAVPGPIESENSKGPHWLIKQGAKLVESVEDVLEELNITLPEGYAGKKDQERDLSALTETERRVYNFLENNPLHIDSVSEGLGFPPQEVAGALLMLEIKGFIRQMPGKMFAVK